MHIEIEAANIIWVQIARIFCSCPELQKLHSFFLSCNESALLHRDPLLRDSWCCKCAKCCFVFMLASAWLPPAYVVNRIFGTNLFADQSLLSTFQALCGLTCSAVPKAHKPFECVGTSSESCLCIEMAVNRYSGIEPLPCCLQLLASQIGIQSKGAILDDAVYFDYYQQLLVKWNCKS